MSVLDISANPPLSPVDADAHRARLAPLLALEDVLVRALASPDDDVLAPPLPVGTVVYSHGAPAPTKSHTGEPVVSQHSKWWTAFSLGGRPRAQTLKDAHTNEIESLWQDPEDPVHALHAAAGAIGRLWRDEAVCARLKERRVLLEESSGLCMRTHTGERVRKLTGDSAAA
jgi:hypothetical protein